MTTVKWRSFWTRRNVLRKICWYCKSKYVVGSSRISKSGAWWSTKANQASCCCPPDSVIIFWSSSGFSCKSLMMRLSKPGCLIVKRSRTVSGSNNSFFCASNAIFVGRSVIKPAVGCKSSVINCNKVVFPAPFGPINVVMWWGSIDAEISFRIRLSLRLNETWLNLSMATTSDKH